MECGLRAGLPPHIIERARLKSQEFEASQHEQQGMGGRGGREGAEKRARTVSVDEGKLEEVETMRKMRKVLALVPCSAHVLQGKEALAVYRKLTELWEDFT